MSGLENQLEQNPGTAKVLIDIYNLLVVINSTREETILEWSTALRIREYRDEDDEVIKYQLPVLKSRLSTFGKKEIFNDDEFWSMYEMSPENTIARASILGRRKKDRFTILVWSNTNTNGSEYFYLTFIGHEQLPRPFIMKFGKDYGLDSHFTKKLV